MKFRPFFYLLAAIIALFVQVYDMANATLTLGFRLTFMLVLIQLIGFVVFTYHLKNVVKNEKRLMILMHCVVFMIYLMNLSYELFLDPSIRVAGSGVHYNLVPFITIKLYMSAYKAGTLSYRTIFMNLAGNMILFMPFGYFIYVLFPRCRNFFRYFIVMFISIALVEIIQVIGYVGTGDIDDLILNLSGTLILYIVMCLPLFKRYLKTIKIIH